MRLINLTEGDCGMVQQAAELLVEGFRENWPKAWPNIVAAREEVRQAFDSSRICRVAVDDANQALGWVGGFPIYDGTVWELHPLVVRRTCQQRGVGRVLLTDFERRVADRGGLTVWVASDDENEMTSLSEVDLYPNPLSHLRAIRNRKKHPYEFYLALGYALCGVLPDANGQGKPDIFLAKRVRKTKNG